MKQSIKKIYIISLILIVVDQLIKGVVSYNMNLYDSVTLIKGFLDINLVHNTGAAFSFLQGGRIIFIVIAVLVIFGLTIYIVKQDSVNKNGILIYGLLLGGIIGNLIDRIIHVYVIDYISFTIVNYKFPVFNFADTCIVIGVILAIIVAIKEELWN